MKRAIEQLPQQPDKVLVDGIFVPDAIIPCEAIINGDNLIREISAASILAKVMRDSEMIALDEHYPEYGFAKHKGYGTVHHRLMLQQFGPCELHRKNFASVKASTGISSKDLA